jgi:hypothetical protein
MTIPLSTLLQYNNDNSNNNPSTVLRHRSIDMKVHIAQVQDYIQTMTIPNDCIVWGTALTTTLHDLLRLFRSGSLLLYTTIYCVLKGVQYCLVRIVFPHGSTILTTISQQVVLPSIQQIGSVLYYYTKQGIRYQLSLRNEQIVVELLLLVFSILILYYGIPYLNKLRRVYIPRFQSRYRRTKRSVHKVRYIPPMTFLNYKSDIFLLCKNVTPLDFMSHTHQQNHDLLVYSFTFTSA